MARTYYEFWSNEHDEVSDRQFCWLPPTAELRFFYAQDSRNTRSLIIAYPSPSPTFTGQVLVYAGYDWGTTDALRTVVLIVL